MRFFLYFLYLLNLFYLPDNSQQPPSDAAEISRDLLYHPAYRIETESSAVVFRAAEFTYRFDRATSQWEVRRERNFRRNEAPRSLSTYRHEASGTTYRFTAPDDDDAGILEIRPLADAEGEPVAQVRLWTRAQLAAAWLEEFQKDAPQLTERELRADLEVAEPEVAAVAEEGGVLWLAIRHYAGEGLLGVGSVLRFDPATNETRLFQPAELAHTSVTHIAASGGRLWLGTLREGEGAIEATRGLVQFHPEAGSVQPAAPVPLLTEGIVTALTAEAGWLWVATDGGICRLRTANEAKPECWNLVPVARLAAPAPVTPRPGAAPHARLPAGSYEVRWANAGFLQVTTTEAVEGWVETDDLAEYEQRRFDARAYELGNTYGGGASLMRVLEKPGSDPLGGAAVYRVALERVGEPERGWQRVRARAGWIRRAGLEITVQIRPLR
jgi:hypothetical protein